VSQAPVFRRSAAATLLVIAATLAGVVALQATRAQSAPPRKATPIEQITGKDAAMYANWLDQDVRWIIHARRESGFSAPPQRSKREILKQFPIRPGDLFNATEIAKGLDSLKKLYACRGYTHFVAIPTPQIDEKQHTVALTL
jgi:Surface antigen variable number repeat